MCENNVNVGQLKYSVAQVNEMLGLAQEWLEQLHHLADHGHPGASAKLAQVSVTLGEARGRLEQAVNDLGGTGGAEVTVELV